ncbi:MAG TPA: hypothetical protein VHC90_22560 [Bryobacteraceae bacterium]|nr:hypothetical protein [Bryobacteraceae bacterium]
MNLRFLKPESQLSGGGLHTHVGRFAVLVFAAIWIATPPLNGFAATINIIPQGGTSCISSLDDSAAQSCSANNGALGYVGYGYAQGTLTGGLHAESESILSVGTNSIAFAGGQASSDATIADSATLTGAPTSGFVTFLFAVDGTLSLNIVGDAGNSEALEFMSVEINGIIGDSSIFSGNQVVATTQAVSVAYSGTSLSLIIALNTNANCGNGGTITQGSTCSASADFSETSRLLGVEILNSAGILAPNAALTSSTGFVYPDFSSMPEPSSLILLSAGLFNCFLLNLKCGVRKGRGEMQRHSESGALGRAISS